MLSIISASKSLDLNKNQATKKYSLPVLSAEATALVEKLKEFDVTQLTKIMNVSYGIAEANSESFRKWQKEFSPENSITAMTAFTGDSFESIDTKQFTEKDFDFAQGHVRILSGLYGILKPLDLIRPYRLDITSKIKTSRGKNLCDFWSDAVTDNLNQELSDHSDRIILNLASTDYFKVINKDKFEGRIINVTFREIEQGHIPRVVSYYSKLSRGLMCSTIIKNEINDLKDLKEFDANGYKYNMRASESDKLVFDRICSDCNHEC